MRKQSIKTIFIYRRFIYKPLNLGFSMKKLLLSIGLFCATLTASAQAFGTASWDKSIDAFARQDQVSYSTPVAVSSNGSTYIAGRFTSDFVFGTSILSPKATSAYVGKLDENGNEQWAVALVGSAEVKSLAADGDGNVYVVGNFTSTVDVNDGSGTKQVTLEGKTDDTTNSSFFMLKISSDGAILAHKTVVPQVKADIKANTDQFFEEAGNTYFRSTKVMWADNRVYFTAQYTGESMLNNVALNGDYFLYSGFMYVSLPKMSILSVSASDFSDLKNEATIAWEDKGSEATTQPESINFTVANGKVFAAFVATGHVKLTTPNKSESFSFSQTGGNLEHGFIYSEISNVTLSYPFNSKASGSETNNNFVNSMIADGSTVYVAGITDQPSVFGNEKTIKGASDIYLAAFNINGNQLKWVKTSNFDEGDKRYNREVLTGMTIANDKVFVTGYTEKTADRKPVTPLNYVFDADGKMKTANNEFVFGLASNHQKIVTGNVNELKASFKGFEITETTAVHSVNADNTIVRNGNEFSFATPVNVTVVNANGAVVLSAVNAQSISVSPLVNGLYILKANNKVVKFVK